MRRRLSTAVATALSVFMAGSVAAAGPNFPTRVDLPDGWSPEGIAAGTGTTFYAGSLASGAIWAGDLRTGTGSILVNAEPGAVAVGLAYEAARDRLWVAGGPNGQVRAYDASSGEILEVYSFAGAGFINDLVVTRDAVYATESFAPVLYVIPLGAGGALPDPADAETLALTGDFTFVPGAFNANGIVAARGWLIVAMSAAGELLRVDPATGEASVIDLGGGSAASGDGLVLQGGTLYVVQNFFNQVAVFRLGAGLASVSQVDTLTSDGFDIPTTAVFRAGRLWAVNARFTTPPTSDTEYWVTGLRP